MDKDHGQGSGSRCVRWMTRRIQCDKSMQEEQEIPYGEAGRNPIWPTRPALSRNEEQPLLL